MIIITRREVVEVEQMMTKKLLCISLGQSRQER